MSESKKIKLVLNEEQAAVLSQALEMFSRASMGQFKYALEAAFPHIHFGYDDGYAIEYYLRDRINCIARESRVPIYFPKEPSASWGIHNKQCGNGTLANNIRQVIRQYSYVTRNDGYFDNTYDSADPFSLDETEQAYVVGFVNYKDFHLYNFDEPIFAKFDKLYKAEKFQKLWPIIDTFKHPKGASSKVMAEHFHNTDGVARYFLRVTKPRKPDAL